MVESEKKTYRCAAVVPGCIQCSKEMYHQGPHDFSEDLPWTQTLEELQAWKEKQPR